MNSIRIHQHGGPSALQFDELPIPEPLEQEVVLRVQAAGVNFIDVYQREGRYPVELPFTPGQEVVGEIVAMGSGAAAKVGERALGFLRSGGYTEYVRVPTDRLIPLPEGLEPKVALAALVQGMTAHFLTRDSYPVRPGDTVLVHAAAGGTGGLLVQFAKSAGARVIGTVSSELKAELARAHGADEVIRYDQQDFVAAVHALTNGEGVQAVYDSVGKTTFDGSLESLRTRGTLVLFGASSGAVPAVDPLRLMRGSLFLTRPTLAHHVADRESLLARADDVLKMLRESVLRVRVSHEFALRDAARAHETLEARQSTGKVLLIPGEDGG
ncbi:quinone oxidoreductase [Deinococcus oregonensis]|uniref:Quinone oxidoreductase n=1 Tax=Deinococcus oregonensis TaxID=1805970 RepID=A0ABV6AY29_9DEIO